MTHWRRRVHAWSTRLYGPSTRVSSLSWLGQERIAIGCLPVPATLYGLRELGVTHIINCRSVMQTRLSQDLALECELFGATKVRHAPMWDSGLAQPPRLWSEAALFGAQVLTADRSARLLVHCQQGRRRSAMVAYAVLRLRGHEPAVAAALVTRHRVEAVLVAAYVDSVETWLATRAR
jgi:protein-tyrosine phosphatase